MRPGAPGWLVCAVLLLTAACASRIPGTAGLSGVVRDQSGPVPGAVVRIQGTQKAVTTDAYGRFRYDSIPGPGAVLLTAWAPGYYNAGATPVLPGDAGAEIRLVPLPDQDNPSYPWLLAEGSCAECHASAGADQTQTTGLLPVDEWRRDAHGQSARNPRFLSMYLGTDVQGRESPPTRLVHKQDYGTIPLAADPLAPDYGPGYKLDFPDNAGNCGSCHVPIAALAGPFGVDPTKLSQVAQEGVSCDFCHKISGVHLDDTGRPAPNRPGVLSLELLRPDKDHQLFMGPFDDVAPGQDSYLPLQRQSQLCAACHFGVFWDTQIYNSYGEWLDSPYSDPVTGKSCQDCHMPARGADSFALADKGGLERPPSRIASHLMPGSTDPNLLQNALTMTVRAHRTDDAVDVEVELLNDSTGHDVPTDSPLRNLILVVRLTDQKGAAAPYREGPLLPDWTGQYAEEPGKVYAKVLEELWTGVSPTAAYWNQTRILSDNRLPPFGRDDTRYRFAASATAELHLQVRLLYRRAFQDLMDRKGWQTPDIVMEECEQRLAPVDAYFGPQDERGGS